MPVSETVTVPVSAQSEAHDQAHVQGSPNAASVLICLGPAYESASIEQMEPVLNAIGQALGDSVSSRSEIMVAYPTTDSGAGTSEHDGMILQPYLPAAQAQRITIQPAATWLSAYELVRAHHSNCCLLLGAEAQSLDAEAMRMMVDAVLRRELDLAIPRYAISPHEGLVNTAVLSPLSRSIFGTKIRFPLTIDLAMSSRMAERMAGTAQKFTTASQANAIVWPVSEAAVGGFSIAEIGCGPRDIPQPNEELSQVLSLIAGSLFSDIEAKATYWQRTRPGREVLHLDAPTSVIPPSPPPPPEPEEMDGLIETFRIGYSNLQEIWSLVLPPNTLVGLKRLSQAPRESFNLPDTLWVRIIYDFVLAHRLRTLSRSHLLGALTPLYLAWVASHILATNGSGDAEQLARAFEADKPYLVSRWRWPDRFNP